MALSRNAHEDRTPSLTITDRPDRVLMCCHAGCDSLDVLEALGLDWGDLFDERRTGKGWTTGTLRCVGAASNGDGRVTFGAVRYMPSAPDGQRKTLAATGTARELWPDPATVPGATLYVVEGEPDAVTAAHMGLPAVAVPGAKVGAHLRSGSPPAANASSSLLTQTGKAGTPPPNGPRSWPATARTFGCSTSIPSAMMATTSVISPRWRTGPTSSSRPPD